MMEANRKRVQELTNLLEYVKATEAHTNEGFSTAVRQAQVLLELTDGRLADELLVSRPTVNRWVRGKNLPYRAVRRSVLDWIQAQLSQKIRTLKAHEVASPSTSGAAFGGAVAGEAMVAKSRY